ncbi:MAG: TPM domain-containing protein [Bacteroidetes bacterium]|nr:TPM domain-containing protein [Bacteroidota bacterium]
MPTARNFFDQREQEILVNAIAQAELRTSGEIRLHIENYCLGSEIKCAQRVFAKLKMHETAERNGVLIYIATLNKKIAVIGDEGIHQKLGNEFWQKIVNDLIKKFKENKKAEAMAECILECGEQLGKYFPRNSDDKNELTNTISY